jgi:hypothetical protein
MNTSCVAVGPDGTPCRRPSFIFDPRRRGMLCQEHAVEPLRRMFGPRPDLDEKAELLLRFLSLPSQARHDLLEALSPEDRREFIELADLLRIDEDLRR